LSNHVQQCSCGAIWRKRGTSARTPAIFVSKQGTGYGGAVEFYLAAMLLRHAPTVPDACPGGHRVPWAVLALAVLCGCSREEPASEAGNDAANSRALSAASSAASVAPPQSSVEQAATGAPSKPEVRKPPDEPKGPRVYAKSRFVWIREHPSSEVQWIGYLWTGGSVALKNEQVHYGPGCERWYAIQPHGYVCVDDKRATLDPNDPVLQALAPHAPDLDSAWPHAYGESRGLKRYTRLPVPPDAPATLVSHQVAAADNANGDDVGVPRTVQRLERDPFGLVTLNGAVHEGRTRLLARSTVAYSAELEHGDEKYLLAADMTWVPKARVTPYEPVTFKGVELGENAKLPLAFFRGKDRPQYRRTPSGDFEETGARFERLSYVELSGERVQAEEGDDEVYLQLKASPLWVKQSDAVVPTPRGKTPWGTVVGSDATGGLPEGRATWMEASVWEGWLIAYEGNQPVYVTLISAGRGGTPVPGKDPLETASTPTGSFPISGKFATATMEAPGEFIHSDVPWTQNFSGPHALHGAYWHDDWGKLKSAGCVNVSPRDGRWLYEFTEPQAPEGWHGVRWLPYKGPATIFVVHR